MKEFHKRIKVYKEYERRQLQVYSKSAHPSYEDEQKKILNDFKVALAEEYAPGIPSNVTDCIWDFVWRRGRAMGGYLKDVEELYWEIASIVEIAWQEIRKEV